MTNHIALEQIETAVSAVDARGKAIDERWGIGRLPMLVGPEMAERFRNQRVNFSKAVWDYDLPAVRKQGDALMRAYDALEAEAVAAHGEPGKPEQWEFTLGGDDDLVILVRDIADVARADTGGRQCQVWSLEEVASVIRAHPVLAAAKNHFAGAVVESVRPHREARGKLDDDLMGLPF